MYSSLNGIREQFKTDLQGQYSNREIEQLFYRLLESFCNKSKTEAILAMRETVDADDQKILTDALSRLRTGEPVQHIDNIAWFMGEQFYVDRHVLIPRPETEELVRLVLDNHGMERVRLLDIGTGSGIIPVSLALTDRHGK